MAFSINSFEQTPLFTSNVGCPLEKIFEALPATIRREIGTRSVHGLRFNDSSQLLNDIRKCNLDYWPTMFLVSGEVVNES